jgi:nitroreductase
MFNDLSSLLAFLTTRRSAKPRELGEPGPTPEQLRQIIAIAGRSPDHGKLHPWRFIHISRERRGEFAGLLQRAWRRDNPAATGDIEAHNHFAHQAPELVIAIFAPRGATKIPLWEQELSCGAACMNLLTGASALGYGVGWVTGWATYSEEVRSAFCDGDEKLAGFIFIGTPATPLEERVRPGLEDVWSEWSGR